MSHGIITRGLKTNSLVTRGYTGFVKKIIVAATAVVDYGRSSYSKIKNKTSEIVVKVQLLEINNEAPRQNISGSIKKTYDSTDARLRAVVTKLSNKIKRALGDIVISVTHVRRNHDDIK